MSDSEKPHLSLVPDLPQEPTEVHEGPITHVPGKELPAATERTRQDVPVILSAEEQEIVARNRQQNSVRHPSNPGSLDTPQ